MALKSFEQWLQERGIRTALGIYPPAYGVGQYPSLYFMPISASAGFSLTAIHHKEDKPKKKKKKKSKE